MCTPTAWYAVITAATAYQQDDQQKINNNYSNALNINEAESARTSMVDQTKQLGLAEIQADDQLIQDQTDIQKDRAEKEATAYTSAGEANVDGIAVDNLMADFYRQEGSYLDTVKYNNNMSDLNLDTERLGIQAQANSRRNNAASRMKGKSSGYASALRVGGQVFSEYWTSHSLLDTQ
jgi:formylmethanofuran dehydrogenase subunit E-like metal-binding protein